MLETFTLTTFNERVGDTFRVYVEAGEGLDAQLIEATSLSSKGPDGKEALRPRPPFSLIFRVPARRRLLQGIYKFENPTLGAFDVFMVPIGLDADGYRCEVIFT